LLFGEQSGLPVFSVQYYGSLNDVKTFCTTVNQFSKINPHNYKLVMDRGFYSAKNVDFMLHKKIKFLIGVPSKPNYYKNIIQDNSDLENDINHTLTIGNDLLFYRSIPYQWDINNELYTHLYLNIDKKNSDKHKLLFNLRQMHTLATENPLKYIDDIKFREVLNFKKSVKSQTGFKVSIRQESIDKLSYNGWFFAIK
jgi:transposase